MMLGVYLTKYAQYHVHTHGPIHGEGRRRASLYKQKMQGIVRGAGIDLSGLSLELSDEDVRYTTDVELGFHNAVLCAKYVGGSGETRLAIWELFGSPGLDMLCKMLYGALHPEVAVDITAVSAVRDDVEHDRFRRMMGNQESLARCLRGGNVSVRFVPSMVSDFCRHAARLPSGPDVISMSPPWMLSEGEMRAAGRDEICPVSTFVRLLGDMAAALGSKGPKVYSVMLPYSWDEFGSVLGRMPGYALAESVTVVKTHGRGRDLSEYHIHYMVRGHNKVARRSKFAQG